ncbi:hypothetical protein [Vibrio owensii]|uniref:hypothetical protein n=1 Tax=Vibrio owensii TaxID=696485 RepID=UPI003CC69C0E
MNDITADFIFVGIVLACCTIGIAVWLITGHIKKKNHQNLDNQIAVDRQLGGNFVESKRFGSEVSLSESTKQIALTDGKRPYQISEIVKAKPIAESYSNSTSISFSIKIEMIDGSEETIKISDVDELIDTMFLFSNLAGNNIRLQSRAAVVAKTNENDGFSDTPDFELNPNSNSQF